MFTDKKRRVIGERSLKRRKRGDSPMVSSRITKAFDSRADSAEMKRFVERAKGNITPFFDRLNMMEEDRIGHLRPSLTQKDLNEFAEN